VRGWLNWRGPAQCGLSTETGLFDTAELGGVGNPWSYPLAGRGTPVISGGRVYALGYEGEGKDLQEVLVCLDARDGALIWEDRWSDFLSDVIYDRYSIGSPTIDPESGDLFVLTTAGLMRRYSPDGELRWEVSTMEELGRLTFPNGRTGAPLIDGDLVIVHIITAHWGKVEGPARDRFYAFNKDTGDVVWWSTPGTGPRDGPYSHPVLENRGGRRLLYAGTGCGNMVCVDARTGEPVWRYRMATGGVNASPVLYGDHLIAIHGRENMDSSTIGRMLSIRLGSEAPADGTGPLELDASHEVWRNELGSFTSSLVLAGDRVYTTVANGDLCCVNPANGEILWRHQLAPDQVHASPVFADGKLYVPMNNGSFHVVRPSDEGAEVLCSLQLEGACVAAPAVCAGQVFVHTTERLYCFGEAAEEPLWNPLPDMWTAEEPQAARLVPGDVLLRVGQSLVFGEDASDGVQMQVRALGPNGRDQRSTEATGIIWPAMFAPEGGPALRVGAGILKVRTRYGTALARVRVVQDLPWSEDFESALRNKPGDGGSKVAFPPGGWIGAFKKWEVAELDGGQVLRKTLANPLFQRAMGFTGHPDMSNYTVQVDIRTDGNRRSMCSAGVVNQRYLIQLMGNYRALQISSNDERIKERVDFNIQPGVWYTLKTRVDVNADGSGVVRARAWPRDEDEPGEWTLEVEHTHAHTHGSPGLFGFSPQSRFHVYLDNYSVTPNE
jgi:outer membrane protein assembly factor BamB